MCCGVLDTEYLAHPERLIKGPPWAPELPAEVWINNPRSKIESSSDSHTTSAGRSHDEPGAVWIFEGPWGPR